MAFFDELGKKITKTGQDVFQKTKDTAETLKLSAMISDEEKKITAFYTEIGKRYYELYSESCESAFEGMISGIKEAKNRIADYSEQIKRLKGIVRCTNCGGDVPYGAPFCSTCGVKMNMQSEESAETADSAVKRCAKCGVPLSDGALFCTGCGARVESVPAVESTPVGRTCPNCNAAVADAMVFCTNCGTKIDD